MFRLPHLRSLSQYRYDHRVAILVAHLAVLTVLVLAAWIERVYVEWVILAISLGYVGCLVAFGLLAGFRPDAQARFAFMPWVVFVHSACFLLLLAFEDPLKGTLLGLNSINLFAGGLVTLRVLTYPT